MTCLHWLSLWEGYHFSANLMFCFNRRNFQKISSTSSVRRVRWKLTSHSWICCWKKQRWMVYGFSGDGGTQHGLELFSVKCFKFLGFLQLAIDTVSEHFMLVLNHTQLIPNAGKFGQYTEGSNFECCCKFNWNNTWYFTRNRWDKFAALVFQ